MTAGLTMSRRIGVLVSAFTLVSACAHAPPGLEVLVPVVSSARVYYDDGPAFKDSVRLVVRDSTTWKRVWAQATSTQPSPPPLPVIDFDHEMAVVVGAGRMTPGDQIRVDSAGTRGGFFVAVVRTIVECRPFPAEAYPLEIVRVAATDKPPSFVERRERAAHCQ